MMAQQQLSPLTVLLTAELCGTSAALLVFMLVSSAAAFQRSLLLQQQLCTHVQLCTKLVTDTTCSNLPLLQKASHASWTVFFHSSAVLQ
jgi:hypothetical protein